MVRTSPHPVPLPPGEGNHVPAPGKSETHPIYHATAKHSPSPWGEGRDEGGRYQTIITPPEVVREKFQKIKPLREISARERGWTLDVLNIVQRVAGTSRCDVRSQQHGVPTVFFLTNISNKSHWND